MDRYDLLIGWLWEYDAHFVLDLERSAQRRRLKTFQVSEHNIEEVTELVHWRKLQFHMYLDRAFDVDPRFETLGREIRQQGGVILNPYERTIEAIDKATMHLKFLTAGLYVPFTIIVSPYTESPDVGLRIEDIAHLGSPFVIKPANTTGGGLGVVIGAETLHDVLTARKELESDKYLLQEKIQPRTIDGRRCWFRCFYVAGKVLLSWWDDHTHVYQVVTPHEEHYYHLRSLRKIVRAIAEVSGLDFFSSEIALREATSFESSHFVVVDYVNDMCDMRTTEIAADGLPNPLYSGIVERLALATAKAHSLRSC
jgi:hypothetical protein